MPGGAQSRLHPVVNAVQVVRELDEISILIQIN